MEYLVEAIVESDFYIAAQEGKLDEAPIAGRLEKWAEKLSKMLTTKYEKNDMTALHWAATNSQLKFLPTSVLTAKNLCIKNLDKKTPVHIAAEVGCINQLPPIILKDVKLLLSKCGGRLTPMHYLAEHGLDALPEICEDILIAPDASGNTPLHILANNNRIKGIPKQFLTKKNLCLANSGGATPLHYMAAYGELDSISEDVLTSDAILLPDATGRTPLHWALNATMEASRNNTDVLLDKLIPIECKEILGEQWWARHNDILQAKSRDLIGIVELPDIDIF